VTEQSGESALSGKIGLDFKYLPSLRDKPDYHALSMLPRDGRDHGWDFGGMMRRGNSAHHIISRPRTRCFNVRLASSRGISSPVRGGQSINDLNEAIEFEFRIAKGADLDVFRAGLWPLIRDIIIFNGYDIAHEAREERDPMSAFRFSRRTVLAAIEVLEVLTQAKFSRYLLELGPQYPQWVGDEGISLTKRLNSLMRLLDQAPDRRTDDSELLRDKIVEKAVSLLPSTEKEYPWQPSPSLSSNEAALLRSLELDGFSLTSGILRHTLPSDVKLPEAENELVRLIKKHGLITPNGHLDQALDAHGRGDWAAANGQIRTFFDSLLDEIAAKLDPAAVTLNSGQARRVKLASLGFLSRDLNEWDDHGLGFINGLAKRLHPQGAHPGLSNEKDSAFRIHIVLLTARLLLTRFDAGSP
jgi:hypothetical protein